MPAIDIRAIVIAFAAELGVDFVISGLVFDLFAPDLQYSQMTAEAQATARQAVLDTTAYLPCMMLLGTATTILGAYFAARLAGRIPYYHGLAMGIVAVVFSLVLWRNPIWYDYVGLVSTIPASLYGAHLARKHMPQET